MNPAVTIFSLEWWQTICAGLCTFAIFSFLYRENVFYRWFEHLFIGIATGWGVTTTVRDFIWPKVLKPLFGLDRPLFPDGTYGEPYNSNYLFLLIPMAFGSLYYFILSKRRAWIAQLVIGFSLGVSSGFAFKGLFAVLIPQLTDSFRSLYVVAPILDLQALSRFVDMVARDEAVFASLSTISQYPLHAEVFRFSWGKSLSNLVFVFTLLTALSYFFFTFSRRQGGLVERSSIAGRWMLMGCFGAFFGSTIMARMALLVDRLDFLIQHWWPAVCVWQFCKMSAG